MGQPGADPRLGLSVLYGPQATTDLFRAVRSQPTPGTDPGQTRFTPVPRLCVCPGKAKQVRIRREGSDDHPKWYAHVFYEVPADRVRPPAPDGALGVDRNCGQATDSDGEVHPLPDTAKLDANIKRKQRKAAKARERSRAFGQPLSHRARRICGQLRKMQRKKKRRREDAAHRHSRRMADSAHTVVLEDLNTKDMTRSAKGTDGNPGRQVKQKAGLNRGILASNRSRLERHLDYKAGRVIKVNPAYTSQTCAVCGNMDKENRRTQAHFQCTACGHTANADHNAALNILERGMALLPTAHGAGASARREAIPLGTSTTREQGIPPPAGAPVPAGYTGI